MSDRPPDPKAKPQRKRIYGPPDPPIRTVSGLQFDGEPAPEYNPLVEMLTACGNARESLYKLILLCGGGRPAKRESFELSLDRNVILLSRVIPKVPPELRRIGTNILQEIKDYRRETPRKDASNAEQAEQARKILDEIEKA
jgi:hypothetical protein